MDADGCPVLACGDASLGEAIRGRQPRPAGAHSALTPRPASGLGCPRVEPAFLSFLKRWVVTTLAVLVAAQVVGGIRYDSTATVLVASLLLGFLNAFVRPLLLLLSLPLLVVSLGLFIVVINALLLLLVAELVKGFVVNGFWSAVWGSLVISAVSMLTNALMGQGPRMDVRRSRHGSHKGTSRDNDRNDPPGGGPVIDV
ncbi:MAG: phage holin family protein [Verrucomicrobiae bacterium]|nr:phage holin family protein [Verrucomicrobiae bacterium]